MINLYSNIMSSWPASIVMSPKLCRLTPSIAQVWDYERISPTSAVGSSLKSLQGSIGEYFERKHFFNEITPCSQKTIGEMMSNESKKAFINALKQTSGEYTGVIENHKFNTVKAYNLVTMEENEIPAIFVALDNISIGNDYKFYPFRDTCGCSCHISLQESINGSLSELMERQSLLVYWLTGKAKYEVKLDDSFETAYIKELIRNLKKEGRLMVLDITLPGAPGHAILSIYGTNKNDNTIKFGAGLSYAKDMNSAIEKSLIELWQSYICMHNFVIGNYQPEDLIDRYQTHFMKCNKYETYATLLNSTTFHSSHTSVKNISDSLIDYLSSLTSNLIMYCSREKTPIGLVWYTKILSPDLFLHMDNSSPININNKLYLQGEGIHEREIIMVPFP